ncbi:amino acid ABC transporter permease [Rhizobium terrae]|uniref:amino acid ABC transporter permease n=1 Tax=Rhizobium terrae TaxID=2171756 RepID=UPI000E3DD9BD|nr:amino acid ABC transporter permease [Rhizobium terrae]
MDFNYIALALPDLLRGVRMTLVVSALAILISLAIAIVGAFLRSLPFKPLHYLVTGYVEFIRGTPYLVQIFFIFYGFPTIGLTLSVFWSGVMALGIWASAYHIENLRAGLAAVGNGMRDASASLGLKPLHHGLFVVFPIALRAALPSIMNTIVSTIKNSAYLQAIGLIELTYVAVEKISYEFRAVEMFASICVIYLACIFTVSGLGHVLERRLKRPYLGR